MSTKKQFIVITGGAGGIGSACARTFKNENLIITDYSQEAVDKTVEELKKDGYKVTGTACDITNKSDIEKLVKFVSDQGGLKALIHTAGVSGTMQNLEKLYTINLVATDMLINAFYELVTEDSVAVLFSSMMAYSVPANEKYDEALRNPQKAGSFQTVSQFIGGNSDILYNYTKRGVRLLTKMNAGKWGKKGARIVSVSPGVIETPMAVKAAEEHPERMEMMRKATPLQRNGTPKEIAEVVAFLVSEKASFITGTDILVDGGLFDNIKSQ